jgi:hypothetical protein
VWFADTPEDFAAAVARADHVDSLTSTEAYAWARAQTWERRWPHWSTAVFGT